MWLGISDALVYQAIPDAQDGLDAYTDHGSLYVKVRTKSGQVKEVTIPAATIRAFWKQFEEEGWGFKGLSEPFEADWGQVKVLDDGSA